MIKQYHCLWYKLFSNKKIISKKDILKVILLISFNHTDTVEISFLNHAVQNSSLLRPSPITVPFLTVLFHTFAAPNRLHRPSPFLILLTVFINKERWRTMGHGKERLGMLPWLGRDGGGTEVGRPKSVWVQKRYFYCT